MTIPQELLNLSTAFTAEEQEVFENKCTAIMQDAPAWLQQQWNGVVFWPLGKPMMPPDIVEQMPEDIRLRYFALLNKALKSADKPTADVDVSVTEQDTFEDRCKAIMQDAPMWLQKQWDGTVFWPLGKPMMPPAIVDQMPEDVSKRYFQLLKEFNQF